MCVYVRSTYACNAAKLIKSHAQPRDEGLGMPQVALANPSPVLRNRVILTPSVSSKHVIATESTKCRVLRGVQEFFCSVDDHSSPTQCAEACSAQHQRHTG